MPHFENFDELIKHSLEDNLRKITFTQECERAVLQAVLKKSLLHRISGLLNYEIEIPFTCIAVCSVFIIGLFAYRIYGYLPLPAEVAKLQIRWIITQYKGVI